MTHASPPAKRGRGCITCCLALLWSALFGQHFLAFSSVTACSSGCSSDASGRRLPQQHSPGRPRPTAQLLRGSALRSVAALSAEATSESVAALSAETTSESVDAIKMKILQISALTDRGQRLNKLIAPTYQDKVDVMARLVQSLADTTFDISEDKLSGEWELVFSDVEIFRSSPFFLAIEEALNSSPGIPLLGKWLGATDPTKKAELFFQLHQLQVMSWGISTVGRVAQRLDFNASVLESSFDTTIFGLTVIPLVGWGKLLPTLGGRVVTESINLTLDAEGTLCMELERTQVTTLPGVSRIPFVDQLLMDFWYPVNSVWKLLPWNGGPFEGRAPVCKMRTVYVDATMRVSRDGSGGLFVYTRPMDSGY
ncbi:unnamed protein product [Polarella glacialis]|uniref:Plastid lipid-associated protein/fibrillin conserved domain-containing protein n=1 Tax=Polarella glacialis TaxID=89957 RepID=A0A813F999_POLGL|nr:unnamed protein product [Polarella glacialis]CAE8681536.1 unnamed protein product [Polarella glacialis]